MSFLPFFSLSRVFLIHVADNSIAGQTKLPTSSCSPKSIPDDDVGVDGGGGGSCSGVGSDGITKITEISSSKDDDLDNENISVTGSGSPDISCVSESETQGDLKAECGAFTSIIQKSHRKSEFMSQLPVNSHFVGANPMINHALAAHLFFQNPLLPPPNQWLYNHLYNNYHDFPWLRHTLAANNLVSSEEGTSSSSSVTHAATTGLNFIKRSITLLTNNNNNNNENDSNDSPPVTSTKRSPSPDDECSISNNNCKRKRSSSVDSLSKENVNEITMKSENFLNRSLLGGAPCVKQNDVWRPY